MSQNWKPANLPLAGNFQRRAELGPWSPKSPSPARSPILCSLLGPGTFISGLHAANKALICWCSNPYMRDTVVKVADVGFLGLLGSLSLAAAWNPKSTLMNIQPLILQTGFSHLVLEMLFNGIAIPAMCASAVLENSDDKIVRTKRQEIMEKAAARNVAQDRVSMTVVSDVEPDTGSQTGLRKDIWLHHFLAVAAFIVVLTKGEFTEEATMLTSVECTCALPVAFGQAAKAKQLKGSRSIVLAVLMCSGFILRVLLSAKLTLPRVLELISVLTGAANPELRTVSGRVLEGSIMEPHRVMLVLCSFGLTGHHQRQRAEQQEQERRRGPEGRWSPAAGVVMRSVCEEGQKNVLGKWEEDKDAELV
ncbi:hypothetical protein GUITHDRAFT_116615 [Guillardia theta CCMP2712]|uniref:Uncharacterized protein n=1 Tax=Guillardia theta (strain CCMP2712) TaxID=905079 RepID=L1ILR7_GUITC|nr:hypothetical protein GUITHDRAFT_116615 [Guillardia theta CCMP2712]EKX37201.1 hypothetical protein GUITHDRAFT_116615 [Guillardia theta CCMP2712]|eukprot:XP_005824181.1 hypothetical protein GUITHDRAFT_116615 [Guillardia theta CCMP2712]